MQNSIQKFCQSFRENELKITFQKMEQLTGTKFKTISAFENGRSNNINHVYLYVMACNNNELMQSFNEGLLIAIKGDGNE